MFCLIHQLFQRLRLFLHECTVEHVVLFFTYILHWSACHTLNNGFSSAFRQFSSLALQSFSGTSRSSTSNSTRTPSVFVCNSLSTLSSPFSHPLIAHSRFTGPAHKHSNAKQSRHWSRWNSGLCWEWKRWGWDLRMSISQGPFCCPGTETQINWCKNPHSLFPHS